MASSGKSIQTTEWWCRGDLTAILESPRGRQELTFTRPYVLIGSGEAADVRLSGPGIPRRLLYVHASQTGLFAVPLIDPSQFHPLPQGWLLDRVPLQLGPYRITFHWQPEGGIREGPREGDLCRRGSLPGLGWDVEVRSDDQALALIHVRRRLTLIGRRKPCAVQFAHPTVSACHCMVIAEGERLWVADLGSANGTLLNGEAVTVAAWPEHVPLSIGRLDLIPRLRQAEGNAEREAPFAGDESTPVPPDFDAGDDRVPTGPSDRDAAPPQPERSERRLRHTGGHPGFPPPHIALPIDSPQNSPIIADASDKETAEGDQPRRSGRSGDEASPTAGPANELAAEDAIPAPSEPGDVRPATERSDDAEGFLPWEHDLIRIATDGEAPWDTEAFLVVPPSADAGQWISQQPAGFAMQDDRSAALVKDLVLSLLAEEAETQDDAGSASRISWSETIVASPDLDACRAAPGILTPEDRAECLARREAELAARETFLHEFAKTLEEMSAELLHFQDSLLAEDDRIQQEKKLLEDVRARLGEDREALCREQDAAMTELRRVREAIHLEERRLAETREEVEAALARQIEDKKAIEELRSQVERERAALQEERLRWEEFRRAAEEEHRRLQREREEWQARHQADLAAWSEQSAALETARSSLAEREAQWEVRRAELEEAERALQRRDAESLARAEALAREQEALDRRQTEVQTALDALARREQALREREQTLASEAQRLAEQAESQQDRETRLAAERNALREREVELDQQHEAWRRRIEEWERRAETERHERIDQANLQAEIERLQAECTRLSLALEARDADSAQLHSKWQAETSRLQAELVRAAEERDRLLEDVRRRDEERRRWEQDREARQAQHAALSAEADRLLTERRQWEQDREHWRRTQTDWESQRTAWVAERQELQSRLAEWEAERRAWEARCAELEDRLSRRQAEEPAATEPTTKGPPTVEDRPEIRTPEDVEPPREPADQPRDYRRYISKQTKPDPLLIPRLPPRRRGGATRWLAAAAVLAGIAAAVTWYRLPRPAMTTATLDFSQAAKLMHARDGTLPAGVDPGDLPFVEPFLPDDEEVVAELLQGEGIRDNAVAASLAEPERQLPGLLFISRSEDVPFMHLRLRTAEPKDAEALLRRWADVYTAALRRRTETAGRAALQPVEAERHDVSAKIARWTVQRKETEGRLGTGRPVELEARHLQAVHMASVGEQELAQLDRQIADLTQRRDAAATAAAMEAPPVETAELNAALETDPEALELRAKLTALESPQASGPEAAAASAQEQVADLRARWDALQAKHRERLARQKKEAAQLTVETLSGELQALEARRNEVTAEIAEQQKIAADCASAAETLRRAEQELPELESRAVRLAAKAEQLQAALADATGKGPEISLQSQNLHEPAEFFLPLLSAFAAALSVLAVWGGSALLIARREPIRYFVEQGAAPESPAPRPGRTGLERASS
ncbi:MAG: hypothetical protein Kow0040_24550 [Thermogutta sp.]